MISETTVSSSTTLSILGERAPPVVKRSFERAKVLELRFRDLLKGAGVDLPKRSCIALSGSVSRMESMGDSDVDYVLLWDDFNPLPQEDRLKAKMAVRKINLLLAKSSLRPCDSFSCDKPISELISTENLFSRYSMLTLVDSSYLSGSFESYEDFLATIKARIGEYAIGIGPEMQVTRTLLWYIQREGWIDQLLYGTSVNRFSRLIQLFATIFSINHFGIDETRKTKTTWLRIEKLEPHVSEGTTECLKKLWVKALELKEKRAESPMLRDSGGVIGVSQLIETWRQLQKLSEAPLLS